MKNPGSKEQTPSRVDDAPHERGLALHPCVQAGGIPDRAKQMAPLVPMQRAGSAEEVARAIVWLLTDEASYTTGAILDVTGGR